MQDIFGVATWLIYLSLLLLQRPGQFNAQVEEFQVHGPMDFHNKAMNVSSEFHILF